VISALLSRCQVYVLEALAEEDLQYLLDQAFARDEWLQSRKLQVAETDALFRLSGGDARKMLSLLEITAQALPVGATLDNKAVQQQAQQKLARFDKGGEQHYDIVSAFIKSMRGSDPNGALYWLARMVEGGEDPKFIARRMVILASEDIGNANPTALVLATNAFQAINLIGWPEGRIILAQCAVYLANSPKSNASYMGIKKAQKTVQETGDLPVPLHLRNAPTKLMKGLGYGEHYRYAHDHPGNFVDQEFLPDALSGERFYEPGNNPREQADRERLRKWWGERYRY
jgi:putative ATPase